MVIEINSSKENILQKKETRFKELKIAYFNQNITDNEILEMYKLSEWIGIHI